MCFFFLVPVCMWVSNSFYLQEGPGCSYCYWNLYLFSVFWSSDRAGRLARKLEWLVLKKTQAICRTSPVRVQHSCSQNLNNLWKRKWTLEKNWLLFFSTGKAKTWTSPICDCCSPSQKLFYAFGRRIGRKRLSPTLEALSLPPLRFLADSCTEVPAASRQLPVRLKVLSSVQTSKPCFNSVIKNC